MRFQTTDGGILKFNIFLLTLGYSRVKFLYVTETRDLRQVEECLAEAFKYIVGVPKEILFDNMRSIIDKARTQYNEPVFNRDFLQFASDCGFVPKACVAYRPETKGKVEVTAKLMNRLKVYSGDVTCFEDIKKYVAELNYEINSTISQATDIAPFDLLSIEQEHLLKTDLSCLQAYFDIIDEIGYLPVDKDAAYGFFQLIAARYEKRPTIFTTNQAFSKWPEVFGDAVLANAIIDRIVHHCEIVKITGHSYRIKDRRILEADVGE